MEDPRIEQDVDILENIEADFPQDAKDASVLSIKELTREMEVRSKQPSGFWAEDVKALQAIFDEEHRAMVEEAKARQKAIRNKREQEKERERQREKDKFFLKEEADSLKKNPRAAFWISMISSENCPKDAALPPINPALARALSRPLTNNIVLNSLDLSHSIIGDEAGPTLAHALSKQKSLRRVELENCQLGPKTITAFAKVLEENSKIAHLSLENNPLTGKQRETFDGIQNFGNSLQFNSTIQMINLWRTGLGPKGGFLIAKHLELNNTIISLGVGCNDMTPSAEKLIFQLLQRNSQQTEKANEIIRKQKAIQLEKKQQEQEEEEREQLRIQEDLWLERRKVERAEERVRKRKEQERKIQLENERKEQERLHQIQMEQQRLEALKKRKKGKKKKK
uniref:Uncharacterized protein n=1 Tax=Mucochytrium quahogii TaxID=96639 RepID=A0A7S2SGH2_9STRA|mmetsp:Transcript_36726/g.59348  ORF Transcript_36726/g.59348 Transcript_36726/m.59348 type:complete len:396 (+) Transcript_36726:224-1411(+)